MMELAEAAPADADEAPQIVAIAAVGSTMGLRRLWLWRPAGRLRLP